MRERQVSRREEQVTWGVTSRKDGPWPLEKIWIAATKNPNQYLRVDFLGTALHDRDSRPTRGL